MTIQGKLEHSTLEGGAWVFRADSGESYHLEGLAKELLRDGARLEVTGQVDKTAFTISMMGSVFQVQKARAL